MSTRRAVCGCLFWLKATFAFLVSCGILAVYAWRIYDLHSKALAVKRDADNQATPVIVQNGALCYAERSAKMRLEPPTGSRLYGYHLRWIPGEMATSVPALIGGRRPAVVNTFFTVDPNANPPYRRDDLLAQAVDAAKINAIFEVTLEPIVSTRDIPNSLMQQIANDMVEVNAKGVPVLLRWGHEMNGNWLQIGGRPLAYVDSFQRLATIIHRTTNMTAMLWSPNIGTSYPYGGGGLYPTAAGEPAEFNAIDTNKNGVLDLGDDPYGPYYPGDQYVDWVGLSLYHYPTDGVNSNVPANYVRDSINGQSLAGQVPDVGLFNFYQRFAANKPFILSESGAPLIRGAPTPPTELTIKQNWWRQTLDPALFTLFPNLRAIVNFEESKVDTGVRTEERDFRIIYSTDPNVVSAFNADLPGFEQNILWANQLKYNCDGTVELK